MTTLFVHKCKSMQNLAGDVSHCLLKERFCSVLYQFIKVFPHVLKDEVKPVVFTDNLMEPHNVDMLQLHQGLF